MDRLDESELYRALRDKSSRLAGAIGLCWQEAEKLLRHAAAAHPTYTSHGPDHALKLLEIIELALTPIEINLNEEELYILIVATLLHDVGMVANVNSAHEDSELIRQAHHIRAHSYIMSNSEHLHIDRHFRKAIAQVAAAHRRIDIERHVVERKLTNSRLAPPRLKLCAALLRLADECHITEDRVPEDYELLGLPEESVKHFKLHLQGIGLRFDASLGQILFTLEVTDEVIDDLAKQARKKIQSEIDGVSPILSLYGIPYKEVIFDEDRDSIVRRKVIRSLLAKGRLAKTDLTTCLIEDGESPDDVTRFLETLGTAPPFLLTQEDDATTTIDLLESEAVFFDLAEEFVVQECNTELMLEFAHSPYAQKALSASFLDKLLLGTVGIQDPKRIIYEIIRKSPSALGYVIKNRSSLPKTRPTMSSPLMPHLTAELQNDFYQYPELLLEPDLLDDSFCGDRESDQWKALKVNQIAVYHRAFDVERLLTQWCVTNGPEQMIPEGGVSLRTVFRMHKSEVLTPQHVMTAAQRMHLPCVFHATEDFNMEVHCNGDAADKPNGAIAMFRMDNNYQPPRISFPTPARIVSKGRGKYVLTLRDAADDGHQDISDYPILVWIQFPNKFPSPTDKPKSVDCNVQFYVNRHLLDCNQANTLLKVSQEDRIELTVRLLDNAEVKLTCPRNTGVILTLPEATELIVKRLAHIQKLVKKRIPFPLWLPDDVHDAMSSCTIKTRKDAQETWEHVKQLIGAPEFCLSPIIVQVNRGGDLHYERYCSCVDGRRQPQLTFPQDNVPEAENWELAFNDTTNCFIYQIGCSHLPPSAIIEHLESTPCESNSGLPDIESLKSLLTSRPEEARTRITCRFLAEENRIFYKQTPFVILLEELTWERWLYEGEYLETDKNDLKRAYLARKEAYLAQPNLADNGIAYGRSAFLVGRTDKAIEVTKTLLSDEQTCQQFIVNAKLGLYNLDQGCEGLPAKPDSAAMYYEKAISILEHLPQNERIESVQSAISDIVEHQTRLCDGAQKYLDRFREKESD